MPQTIHGAHQVLEAIRAGRRRFETIYLSSQGSTVRLRDLETQARARGIPIRRAPPARLAALAGSDRHQGVVAVVARIDYVDLQDLLDTVCQGSQPPLLVVLDQVQDPRNLGAVMRCAEAAGAHGVIVPERRSAGLTEVVLRASSGAAEHLPVARVGNLRQALEAIIRRSIWTYATAPTAERTIYEVDLAAPACLVFGSEGKGVRPLVAESCDDLVRIPMAGQVSSLNVAAAAAVCLFEAGRQRSLGRGLGSPGNVPPAMDSGPEGDFRP